MQTVKITDITIQKNISKGIYEMRIRGHNITAGWAYNDNRDLILADMVNGARFHIEYAPHSSLYKTIAMDVSECYHFQDALKAIVTIIPQWMWETDYDKHFDEKLHGKLNKIKQN
jgi:hypothetical protein